MRKPSPIVLLFLLPLVAGHAQIHQTTFMIGAHGDPTFSMNAQRDALLIDSLKAAHFNFMSGVRLVPNNDFTPANYRYVLERIKASGGGIYITALDTRLWWSYQTFSDATASAIAADYKALPADLRAYFCGYFITDEPSNTYSAVINQWVNAFDKYDSEKTSWANLLPTYVNWSDQVYAKYIADYVQNAGGIIGYDYYCFGKAQYGGMRNSWFKNMKVVADAITANPGKRFWITMLGTEHYFVDGSGAEIYAFAPISRMTLRFVAYSPILYGATGILYYTYESPGDAGTEKYMPAARENPSIYGWMKDQNAVLANLGPTLMNLKWRATVHGSSSSIYSGETVQTIASAQPPYVKSISHSQAMVGVFDGVNGLTGGKYLAVFNKDTAAAHQVDLQVEGNYRLSRHAKSTDSWTDLQGTYSSQTNRLSLSLNMQPADIELIRLSAPTRVSGSATVRQRATPVTKQVLYGLQGARIAGGDRPVERSRARLVEVRSHHQQEMAAP